MRYRAYLDGSQAHGTCWKIPPILELEFKVRQKTTLSASLTLSFKATWGRELTWAGASQVVISQKAVNLCHNLYVCGNNLS
jgi:hypothetical protein